MAAARPIIGHLMNRRRGPKPEIELEASQLEPMIGPAAHWALAGRSTAPVKHTQSLHASGWLARIDAGRLFVLAWFTLFSYRLGVTAISLLHEEP